MGETFRREVVWQAEFRGPVRRVSGLGPTADDAEREAIKQALEAGYREREWWEFWRWMEKRPNMGLLVTPQKPQEPA